MPSKPYKKTIEDEELRVTRYKTPLVIHLDDCICLGSTWVRMRKESFTDMGEHVSSSCIKYRTGYSNGYLQ